MNISFSRDILKNMSQFYLSGLAEMLPVEIGVLCLMQRGYGDKFWLMADPQNHLSVFLKQYHKGTTMSYKMFKRLELEDIGFIKVKEVETNKGPLIGPGYHEICQLHCTIAVRGKQYLDTLPRMTKLLGVTLWCTSEVEKIIRECPSEEFPELLVSDTDIRDTAQRVYKELYGK